MKVLYLGDLDRYGTCYSRLQSLAQIHPNVVTFDDHPFQEEIAHVSRWNRDFAARMIGRRANAELLDHCAAERPDLVWVDKGEWITPGTLHKLRAGGTFLVRHITDALYPTQPLLM